MERSFLHESCDIAEELIAICRARGVRLVTAESCTGGLIGAILTRIPGASEVFDGGIICYQNRIKSSLLGVSEETLQSVGAVSEACAAQMAAGAVQALGSDLALAVTGIAGPGGGTAEKPVGLVFTAIAWQGQTQVCKNNFSGDRDSVRAATARKVLNMALTCLKESESKANGRH